MSTKIEKTLIYASNETDFKLRLEKGDIDKESVVFIDSPREIWTQGIYFPCPYTKEQLEVLVRSLSATTVSSVSNLPTSYQVVVANISSNQTLTFGSFDNNNREIHVLIRNTGSSDITVTMSNQYIIGGDSELLIEAGSYGEVNCVKVDSSIFVRGIGS